MCFRLTDTLSIYRAVEEDWDAEFPRNMSNSCAAFEELVMLLIKALNLICVLIGRIEANLWYTKLAVEILSDRWRFSGVNCIYLCQKTCVKDISTTSCFLVLWLLWKKRHYPTVVKPQHRYIPNFCVTSLRPLPRWRGASSEFCSDAADSHCSEAGVEGSA